MSTSGQARERAKIVPPVSLYWTRFSTVNIGATSEILVRPDPRRVSLSFAPNATNAYRVWPESTGVVLAGFNVPTGADLLTFDWSKYAVLVNGEWWGISAAASVDVMIAEVLAF